MLRIKSRQCLVGAAAILLRPQLLNLIAEQPWQSPPHHPPRPDITTVTIEDEMKRSYLDYAMSVIVARRSPTRDGLKPVHRRILYSMKVNGNEWNRGYRKSARIGDVIGKYHRRRARDLRRDGAHGEDFAMRLPLIDGQGNFGVDGR